MCEADYKQKVKAYEKAYNKKLDYSFDYSDIAGYSKKDQFLLIFFSYVTYS